MKINLGDFGNSTQGVAPQPNTEVFGQAIANFGGAVSQFGAQVQKRREELAAAKASTALTDHELKMRMTVETIKDRLARGELSPEDAQTQYQAEMSKLAPASPANLSAVGQEYLDRGVNRSLVEGGFYVDNAADATRRADFKNNFRTGVDNLKKLAGMPGAIIPAITKQLDSYKGLGRNAGVPPIETDQAIQDAKDQIYLDHATQRSIEGSDSMEALQALEHDLTASDGMYYDKLDTNKRNSVLRGVKENQNQLINRSLVRQNKRDSQGERALAQYERQIPTGVPATAAMLEDWHSTVKDTPSEQEFMDLQHSEEEVQAVLRLPISEQIKWVENKSIQLFSKGGSVQDKQATERAAEAVKKNIAQLVTNPLLYAEARTGVASVPLDFAGLITPEGRKILAEQFGQRLDTVNAMKAQHGTNVETVLLKPDEAAVLTQALDSKIAARGDYGSGFLGLLRQSAGNDANYKAILQQIAPDAPVKAQAGLVDISQYSVTLERNFVTHNVVAKGPDIAKTMLYGDSIINPPKGQKAEDGKVNAGLVMPDSMQLQAAFTGAVGNAFKGNLQAAQRSYQFVQAYYVGAAAQRGLLSSGTAGEIDSDLVDEAITATVGERINYNGNGDILLPWGMNESEFNDRIHYDIQKKMQAGILPKLYDGQISAMTLQNKKDGDKDSYAVYYGRTPARDNKGALVILDVSHAAPPPAPIKFQTGFK